MTALAELENRYRALASAKLSLNLTRGKPAAEQLDLSNALDGMLQGDFRAGDGTDARNYGGLRGLPEARELGARFLDVEPEQVMAAGNSSLTLMFQVLEAVLNTPVVGPAWRDAGAITALCPSPGYDRHYAVSQAHGMRLEAVPMTDDGPDMDAVERSVEADPSVRCIWCVPKFSNPTGCVYSPDTVRRLAELPARAGRPFLVLWDNAYAWHDVAFPRAELAPLLPLAEAAGTADSMALFASTSKVTFSGGGIAFVAGSQAFLAALEARLSAYVIGPDKVNQLRHARFLAPRLDAHMRAHAEIVRPKFEAVQRILSRELDGTGLATWTQPRGGYFVSLDTRPGFAAEVVAMAGELGVALTPAGSTYPYGHDPEDRNIRLAPTFASLADVEAGVEAVALCIQLAAARRDAAAGGDAR